MLMIGRVMMPANCSVVRVLEQEIGQYEVEDSVHLRVRFQ